MSDQGRGVLPPALSVFTITWTASGQQRRAQLAVGFSSVSLLKHAVQQAFEPFGFKEQAFTLTDGHEDITTDEHAARIQAGDSIMVLSHSKGRLGMLVAKETISFSPHPKTLTMAGDYEYFAAQGHHPFAFALAELIDNALRATKGNAPACPRSISISLVVSSRGDAGLVRVQDNGCGMSKKELNEWAVMNLSMEDRGLMRSADHMATESAKTPGGSRYLTGDLSYFGVGSKNAAFFIGQAVKLTTRQAGGTYVHELCITAEELERRYNAGAAVYEGDMIHRQPGDAQTLTAAETAFPSAAGWVADEVGGGPQPAAAASAAATAGVPPSSSASGSSSFTRVTIGKLKEDALQQLVDADSSGGVLRDLAHLYHYYLHGAKGNTSTSTSAGEDSGGVGPGAHGELAQRRLPSGELAPIISVEYIVGDRTAWCRSLADVDDDMETRYLRAARAHLEFALDVPGKGLVEGVLWYFPFDGGHETVPADNNLLAYRQAQGHQGPTQAGGGDGATQACGGGQLATQVPGPDLTLQLQRALQDLDEPGAIAVNTSPMFETFWQGRLIPGGAVEVLPFIESVRSKRNTALGRDELPDEVFTRMRGALFFGPTFKVTRNKLTFRDNLAQLLAGSVPVDRALEKKLREWVVDCHRRLDRTVRFSGMADERLRAMARRQLGEGVTAFSSISDGARCLTVGDVVQLATKPRQVGRVLYFSINQVVQSEGCYARGFVTYSALPASVHGAQHVATVALRRVEGPPLSEEQQAQHAATETKKLPCSLRVEPIKFGSCQALDVCAGDVLPDTAVNVLNGAGQRMKAVTLGGHKSALRVTQMLMYLGPGRVAAAPGPAFAPVAGESSTHAPDGARAAPAGGDCGAAEHAAAAGGKRAGAARKRRKAAGGAAAAGSAKENQPPHPSADEQKGGALESPGRRAAGEVCLDRAPAPAVEALVSDALDAGASGRQLASSEPLTIVGEEVLKVENKTPIGDAFQFNKIVGGMSRSGTYQLLYVLGPDTLPCVATVFSRTTIYAAPGAPHSFELQGEGRSVTRDVQLGEVLPPIRIVISDALSNALTTLPLGEDPRGLVTLDVVNGEPGTGSSSEVSSEVHVMWALEHHNAPGLPTLGGGNGNGVGASVAGLWLEQVQLMGPQQGSAGMSLFDTTSGRAATGSSRHSPAQQQQGAPSQAVTAAEVYVVVRVRNLGYQTFPVRLLPGAPHSLQLLHGHPFGEAPPPDCGAAMATQLPFNEAPAAASVVNGEELPELKVRSLDRWGNRTGPTRGVTYQLQLDSPVLQPDTILVDFDQQGVAVVCGLCCTGTAAMIGEPQVLELSLKVQHSLPSCAGAVAAAEPLLSLRCSVLLLAGTRPASIVLMCDGQVLEEAAGSTGEGVVQVLPDVLVGTTIRDLSCRFLDEAGRPAPGGAKGKLQLSWVKGAKRVVVDDGGEFGPLAVLRVGSTTSDGPLLAWVRFKGEGTWSDLVLDAALEVPLVSGPPHHWSMALVEFNGTPAVEAGGMSNVECGKPFCLELEVLDAHNNRCRAGPDCALPSPRVTPHCDDGELVFDASLWAKGWGQTQAGHSDLFGIQLVLAGRAGPIKLVVDDCDGPDGVALLVADELPLELGPGPPKALVVDLEDLASRHGQPPLQLSCGKRGCLGDMTVRLVDEWGNGVKLDKAEVVLKTDAHAADGSGSGIRLTAVGSNRVKLKQGIAVLKQVRVDAGESPAAVYKLLFEPGSRKLDVTPATLLVQVCVQNLVSALTIDAASLAGSASGPARLCAGSVVEVAVSVTTEDGQLLTQAAAEGLLLKLCPPGGSRGDVVSLSPMGPPMRDDEGGMSHFIFHSLPLTVSGQYTATAEYTEQRPDLQRAAAECSGSSLLRSTSLTFDIEAGPPVSAAPAAPSSDIQSVAATNAQEAKDRCVLSGVAVQLLDQHGNAAPVAGLRVRWLLAAAGGAAEAVEPGSVVPELECSPGELECATDGRGRAFFGDLFIKEGSGHVGGDAGEGTCAAPVLQLELALHLWQPGAPGPAAVPASRKRVAQRDSAATAGGWLPVWSCAVSFSDDARRSTRLQLLYSRRDELLIAGRTRRTLEVQAHKAVESAGREQQRAAKAVDSAERGMQGVLAGCHHTTSAAAEVHLAAIQERQHRASQALEAREEVTARFGAKQQPMTSAIQRCLSWGDSDVVGIVAQLGTVDDPRLAALLSYTYSSTLTNLVVKSSQAGQRLRAALLKDNFAVPSYAPYDMLQVHVADSSAAAQTSMCGLSGLASQLLADACEGSDPPLVHALPHTRILLRAPQGAAAAASGLPANQYPPGFVGHACNLIRPVIPGHRAKVVAVLIGSALVFETLDQGSQYRQYVTQVLRGSVNEIITLDGGKIAAKGVVQGSGYKVPRLSECTVRFGTTPRTQVAIHAAAEHVAALEGLVQALRAKEAADAIVTAAQQAEADTALAAESEQGRVAEEMVAVRSEIADLEGSRPAKGARHSKGAKRQRDPAAVAAAARQADEDAPGEGAAVDGNDGDAEPPEDDGGGDLAAKRPRDRRKRAAQQ